MKTTSWRNSLIFQVALMFAIGMLLTVVLTNELQLKSSDARVKRELEKKSVEIAGEVRQSVMEYPAYKWLIYYWQDNADTLDLEYDADFSAANETSEKSRILSEHQPQLQLKYATEAEIEALPAEDQKLYAEIIYSWMITRINQIKKSYDVDYLFCVTTDTGYRNQFFLLSAADDGAVRGTNYEEVYPLGVTVRVSDAQSRAMRDAVSKDVHVTNAGEYVDCYAYLDIIGRTPVLVGLTYSLASMNAEVTNLRNSEIVLTIALQMFLLFTCLISMYHYFLNPIRKVQKHIRQYMSDKDSEEIIRNLAADKPENEIGELAGDVSDLAREIDEYTQNISRITAEKERINTELSLATRIQTSMIPNEFPPFPEREEFDIYALMDPAREVGGDFYDFFMIDDDHLCVVIADVSGKGIPAALFMMSAKIILNNNALAGKSPARILTDTNNLICENNKVEMFVTVWVGILEISTGRFTAANAGHEYPFIRHADGDFELYKDKHGFVVGGLEGVPYSDYEIMMKPGDKIFVYTDGLTESNNPQGEMFGMDRIVESLNKVPEGDAEKIVRNVRHDFDVFTAEAEQFDDLTMLCLEYKGVPLAKPEPEYTELTVGADLANFPAVNEFIETELEKHGFPMKEIFRIDTAVDELFTNIASYAYGDQSGDVTVRFGFDETDKTASIAFIDRGEPFDPYSAEVPDTGLPAEERKIGGLGIHMVKEMMDSFEYRYEDGCNINEIKKSLIC